MASLRLGFIISAIGHLALITWAVLGGWFLSPKESEVVEVSDVSVISAAEFDAALSSAPADQPTEISAISPPEAEAAPSAPSAENEPAKPEEPSKIEAADVPSVAPLVDAAPEPVAAPEPEGFEVARPGAELGSTEPRRAPQGEIATTLPPREAPRIDTSPAPKPPEPVEQAEAPVEEIQPAPEPAEAAQEPVEKVEQAAPQEAQPELVLEKEAAEVAAPKLAARPKGRPKRAGKTPDVKVAAAPKPKSAETETSAPAPEVKSPAVEPAPAAGRYVLGSDMSRNEKFAISGQIENRWNIASFEGRPNWETLVVVVEVQLTQNGEVMNNSVRPHTPKTPTGDLKTAYSAARRAILMAQPFDLPKNKFQDGDWLRIRFNPAVGGITLN